MSTTKQIVVHKGLNNIIRSRASGYWDNKSVFSYTSENENKNVSMDVYDGLSGSFEVGISSSSKMDFSDTVLPWKWDYSDELKEKRFCLMPVGNGDRYQNIPELSYKYNFTVVGSPNINNRTKVVSDFSTSNLLRLTNMPTYSAGTIDSFELQFKVHTPTSENWTYYSRLLNDHNSYDGFVLEFPNNNREIVFKYGATDLVTSNVTGLPDTDYWIRVTYDGSTMLILYSLDGISYIEGASRLVSKSDFSITTNAVDIGARPYGDQNPECNWPGSIDLDETYIKINDEYYWNPTFTEVPKINYNFTKVGTPTIDDFIVSGFSSSNYIQMDDLFNPGTSTWEQQIKFTTGNNLSYSYQRLTGTPTDMKGGANIVIKGARLQIWLTSTNSNWNICIGDNSGGYSEEILQTNTTYWTKLIFDGSKYILSYSSDDVNFTDIITVNNSTAITSTQATSFGAGSGNYPFYGSIDLSETYIKINNEMWWKGAEYAVESLKGCLYNYTDTGASSTLNAFVVNDDETIVLTPDSTHGDNRYLGTVTVPAHDLYSYNNGVWTKL